ncbi:YihY/virulence factor BrkB family protein [Clostridium manihotivorum]|uniref:YihY/virulence factor BrkB family protein n=1 Tax=Clostridium manihotivorum TaxID=2320868 RepID=A0A3R5X3B8_9CLOT|nr:YihY/virulence factor BrkB family protein [Clostridium manihotivorum]QAA33426.1 YihY/virulence factor BrkB family protein [Clostridium manihotivorum]
MLELILDLFKRFNDDDVPSLSSQLAFNLLLSFFPFLIFLMTILGRTSLNGMDILMILNKILPENVFSLIRNSVLEIINKKNSGLMSFSLIVTLWTASAAFNSVIKGLNKAYDIIETRSFIIVRLVSMLCTIGMAFLIVLVGLLLVFGRIIWREVDKKFVFLHNLSNVWSIGRYSIVVALGTGVFTLLYYFAPSTKLKWKEVIPGAIFSTIGMMAVSSIFAYYVDNFANYSLIYGSLGAIMFLLTWLFLASIIVIMGGEFNASIASRSNNIITHRINNIRFHI